MFIMIPRQNIRYFADDISKTIFVLQELYFYSNFTEVCSEVSNWQLLIIASANGSVAFQRRRNLLTHICVTRFPLVKLPNGYHIFKTGSLASLQKTVTRNKNKTKKKTVHELTRKVMQSYVYPMRNVKIRSRQSLARCTTIELPWYAQMCDLIV